ncbi:hypothetical protein K2X89_10055, partial [Myxococcota bacterium]|nr:hypothetical protein [Myxococcota bacterium]
MRHLAFWTLGVSISMLSAAVGRAQLIDFETTPGGGLCGAARGFLPSAAATGGGARTLHHRLQHDA